MAAQAAAAAWGGLLRASILFACVCGASCLPDPLPPPADAFPMGGQQDGGSSGAGATGVVGDVNGDGLLDGADVWRLAQVLSSSAASPQADVNRDGKTDGRDIQYFVDSYLHPPVVGGCCLSGGSCLLAAESRCASLGGTYQGDGTVCSVLCPTQPPPVVFSTAPSRPPPYCNTAASSVVFTIRGTGFAAGATVVLSRPGQSDLLPASFARPSSGLINAEFALAGVSPGSRRITVTNPDGQTGVGAESFEIVDCP
ncbi:MAG: dockerin type I domain-containing protein [Phycisphaerae bacterium]